MKADKHTHTIIMITRSIQLYTAKIIMYTCTALINIYDSLLKFINYKLMLVSIVININLTSTFPLTDKLRIHNCQPKYNNVLYM